MARYGDLLLEKAKENSELEMKHQQKTEELAQNFQNEIVTWHEIEKAKSHTILDWMGIHTPITLPRSFILFRIEY